MKTKAIAVLFLLLMIVAGGCATNKARGVIPMSANPKGLVKMETEDVVIRVFPILNKDDSKTYFDENLLSDRILAIFLEVFSKTSNETRVVSLELRRGETILQPLTTNEVYKVVKREYIGKAFLWALPTYFVGGPISAIHTYRINKEIERDIKEKEFRKEVKPFGTSGGFVWFKIPKDMAILKDKGGGLPKGVTLNLFLTVGAEKKLIELFIS